jgi:hypothetical protein
MMEIGKIWFDFTKNFLILLNNKMALQWYFIAAIGALVIVLISIPIWNKYLRKQVFLVNASVGSDTNSAASSNPSNLSAMQAVAQQFNAEIATLTQLGEAAQAGAEVDSWGWISQVGSVYMAGFPVQNPMASPVAAALGCGSPSSTNAALRLNPCLASVVPNTASCPNAGPGSSPCTAYAWDATNLTVSCTGGSPGTTMSCNKPNFITAVDRFNSNSGTYLVNPSTGVWLYGVKPSQTDSNATDVQPFNVSASQWSQYGFFSL